MNTVELASRILTQLGFYQEPSREIGIDDRRDNIVHLIEEYTHPANTLTDEEIIEVCKAEKFSRDLNPLIDFARAILRKAQEK
jgi:hypothetical protein